MPIYPCKCECGHYEEVYRTVAEYKDLPHHCGKRMTRHFTPTNIMADMEPYRSPLDGSVVKSRKHHRDHMRKHGVIEVGNEKIGAGAKKEYQPKGVRDDIYKTMHEMNALH